MFTTIMTLMGMGNGRDNNPNNVSDIPATAKNHKAKKEKRISISQMLEVIEKVRIK